MLRRFSERNSENLAARRRRILASFAISRMQLTVGLLLALGGLVIYTLFFSGVFVLHIVKFLPEQTNCVSNEQIKAEIPRGKNLVVVRTEELGPLIKAKFPCLEEVSVIKQFPDSLLVTTSERKTAALIKVGIRPEKVVEPTVVEASASSESAKPKVEEDKFKIEEELFGQVFGVDKEGFVLKENPDFSNSEMPIFYFLTDKPLSVNANLEKEVIRNSIEIVNQMRARGITFAQAKIDGDDLYIIGPEKYIFLLKKDVKTQVVSLQLIQQKAKIDSATIEKIDLRFDKPVVVYSKKK